MVGKALTQEVQFRSSDGRFLVIFKLADWGDRVWWIDFYGGSIELSLDDFYKLLQQIKASKKGV